MSMHRTRSWRWLLPPGVRFTAAVSLVGVVVLTAMLGSRSTWLLAGLIAWVVVAGVLVLLGRHEPLGPARGSPPDGGPSLKPEPSELVRRYLHPTEHFEREWRRHWIRLAKELAVGAAAAVAIRQAWFGLGRIPFHELVGPALWVACLAWRSPAWYSWRFALTTARILVVKGFLWPSTSSAPLRRAADIGLSRSPLARLFRYGTLRFPRLGVLHGLRRVGDLPAVTWVYVTVAWQVYDAEAANYWRDPRPGFADPLDDFPPFEEFPLPDDGL